MKKVKKTLIVLISIILVISLIYIGIEIKNYFTRYLAHIEPQYEKISIEEILEKDTLSDADYKTLFYQTGLGHVAIDDLMEDKSQGIKRILEFQDNFFKKVNISYEKITPITYKESIVDENGNYAYGTKLAPLENGYIIVARATYSLGWRHGHAAIVVDKDNELSLEAAVLGYDSDLFNVNNWRCSPNFMILKLKDASVEQLNEIAQFAEKTLYGVPYKLTSGFFGSKYTKDILPTGTHCSHLAWYPFMEFGYDLDSNGGWIVTPKDIANSPFLEIVQIYGFDPDELWK